VFRRAWQTLRFGCGTVEKTVKHRPYLYFWTYDRGAKTEVYVGPAGLPETNRKASELELEHLVKLKEELDTRIQQLRAQLKA
jgi:hypothetical protein